MPLQERSVFTTQLAPLPQYLGEMSLSDFCLVPMGSTPWTLRLYDALFTGCIPVLLSDHIELPFDERIDWTAFTIKWPQADAERLPSFLLSLSQQQVRDKRRAIVAARHNFAWCGEGGAFAQLVATLNERKLGLRATLRDDYAWVETPLPASFWVEKPGDVAELLDKRCSAAAGQSSKALSPNDVVTISKGPFCVLRAALRQLEARVRPRKVHLIADSCDGVEDSLASFRVRCIELASVLPSVPAESLSRIPPERKGWCALYGS